MAPVKYAWKERVAVHSRNFPSFPSLWTWIPYILPSKLSPSPSSPPCSRWPGKSARKRKRISGLRDPARRECSGEASKKCGQIVSPRHTDRCKEIISVSKPHEPFDRSFQPFSPSVSASRFTETSARSRSPVSSSRSTFLLLLFLYFFSSRLFPSLVHFAKRVLPWDQVAREKTSHRPRRYPRTYFLPFASGPTDV